jgi:hypothetical protein
VAIDPHLWLGGGGIGQYIFLKACFKGFLKICQPAINGGEQSEKSLQILIISFFGQYCDIFGGILFGKL